MKTMKLRIALGTFALFFALALLPGGGFGIHHAGAVVSESTSGWNRDNFASTCRWAGGRVVEIDSPGLSYSKCVFPDGSYNKCNWTTGVCTFGNTIQASPNNRFGNLGTGTLVSTTSTTSSTNGTHSDS